MRVFFYLKGEDYQIRKEVCKKVFESFVTATEMLSYREGKGAKGRSKQIE